MADRLLPRVFLLTLLFLTACTSPSAELVPQTRAAGKVTLTPFQPEPAPAASAVPRLWIDPAVPKRLRAGVRVQGTIPADMPESANIRLDLLERLPGGGSTWVYALVAAFPTVRDGVSFDELKDRWSGRGSGLVMSESTYAAMQTVFGGQAGGMITLIPEYSLKTSLWQEPDLWGIVPFEELGPEMKVLEIDGRSPIHPEFITADYPLKAVFALQPDIYSLPASNRDPAKLTTVLMTGTTALVRAISFKMQEKGVEYPASDIGSWLRSADILHISNEVAFTADCPAPDPFDGKLRFCSALENIALLDAIGADVIELSGNHVNDWGGEALLNTLTLYHERGWPVFAGGVNLDAARKPAILERGGVQFAFIGCNLPGPEFAWAVPDGPGAAHCGDYGWLVDEIKRLKASGAVVIVTLQHYEYYTPDPRPNQLEDFRMLAEAGADVVSGSQAHYAQAFEFYNGTFIHYGLGNLFFDQMGYDYAPGNRTTDIRREFLDRHVFYAGRLISTELLTAMLEDYSKPRPMTAEERAAFLTEYFTASGWQP